MAESIKEFVDKSDKEELLKKIDDVRKRSIVIKDKLEDGTNITMVIDPMGIYGTPADEKE
jgi:hypothetical protein